MFETTCSETDSGSSPMSSLGVISDCVVSSVSDPVRQSSVGLHALGHSSFSSESFKRSHIDSIPL